MCVPHMSSLTLLPSLSSGKTQQEGIWDAFTACGLWAWSPGERVGGGRAGRAVPLDRYPCAQPEGWLWAKQEDSVSLSFHFIQLFWGRGIHLILSEKS